MASKRDTTAVQKVQPDISALVAQFEGDDSLDSMAQHRIVPRLKIMQGLSEQGMKEAAGGEGAVVLAPGGMPLCPRNEIITVNPLFFFAEYVVWNDKDDTSLPRVHDRSFELATSPKGDIARRALDMKLREERYGGTDQKPLKRRWVEHLCFVCMLVSTPDGSATGEIVTLSFEKGENMQGRSFINSIRARRVDGPDGPIKVALWAQLWNLKTSLRTKGSNKWWGFDFTASDPSIINPEDAAARKALHENLKAEFAARTLVVDRADEGGDDPSASVTADEKTPM